MYIINMEKPKVIFFTGAGISAESGIPTFRDKDGLWEGVDPMVLAHINTWKNKQNRDHNRGLMLDFYNERRKALHKVEPNAAHIAIAEFEKSGIADVKVITQNIDDLHERAGSKHVSHLHGELFKARTTLTGEVLEWKKDMFIGDRGPDGSQVRPHIVWFGEPVPQMEAAAYALADCDIVVVVGTSLNVYPAAGVFDYLKKGCGKYIVNPVIENQGLREQVGFHCYAENATTGVEKVINKIKKSIC